jgi:hypothetical protein
MAALIWKKDADAGDEYPQLVFSRRFSAQINRGAIDSILPAEPSNDADGVHTPSVGLARELSSVSSLSHQTSLLPTSLPKLSDRFFYFGWRVMPPLPTDYILGIEKLIVLAR